jgi:outer membrane protein assembly factor BamB
MKKVIFISLLIFVFIIISNCGNNSNENIPGWFTELKGPDHRGHSKDAPRFPLELKWQKQFDGVNSASVVCGINSLFINIGKVMYSLNPENGEVKWKFEINRPLETTATVIEGGDKPRLFFTSQNGTLYCLYAKTGELSWKLEGDNLSGIASSTNYIPYKEVTPLASSKFYSNGMVIYLLNHGNRALLRAVDSIKGTINWETYIGEFNFAPVTPLCMINKSIYVVLPQENCRQVFTKINAENGEIIFSHNLSQQEGCGAYTSGVIGYKPDKPFIYLSPKVGEIICTDINDSIIWNTKVEDNSHFQGFALEASYNKGTLIASTEKYLYAFSANNGNPIWKKSIDSFNRWNGQTSRPVIWGKNIVYVDGIELKIYNIENGNLVWNYKLNSISFAASTVGNKKLIITTDNGTVYLFESK